MSDTEETNERKLDSDELAAQSQEVAESTPEKSESEEPSSPAPSAPKAILYGTRKRRPGASNASAAKTLDQIRGAYDDDDIVEMDDLVVKSTAPSHLVGGARPASPKRRERLERHQREEKEEEISPEEKALDSSVEAYPEDEPSQSTETTDDNRPERFGTLKEAQRPSQRAVEEFRPSTDGKRAAPKKRVRSEDRPVTLTKPPKKKGFFGWLKSLFSSQEETPKPTGRRNNKRGPNQRRRSPNGQNRGPRENNGERSNNRQRGGRNRNRGPRNKAEGRNRDDRDPREGGDRNREGGNRRRRRRPQGERRESPSE
jgi:hypothetical protein